jgi:hypothetical protein
VALVAIHYNLIYFCLLGMETAMISALITLGVSESVAAIRKRRAGLTAIPWYALAVCTRLDALPLAALALAFECAFARRDRAKTLIGVIIIGGVIGAQFIGRRAYYGEWWPNTYYLKLTGWPLADRVRAGLEQGIWMALSLGLPALLAGVSLLARRRRHLLPAAMFASSSRPVAVCWFWRQMGHFVECTRLLHP